MTQSGIWVIAALYFGIALLTPIAATFAEGAKAGTWPALVVLVSATLTGLVQGLIALRAYYDGSNERFKARRDAAAAKRDG
jgi:hypothetical protein